MGIVESKESGKAQFIGRFVRIFVFVVFWEIVFDELSWRI
jgi:hypothetical protein